MANSTISYVENISFVVSDSTVHGVPNMVEVDMNAGSRGKYIYPIIHYTNNRSNAITGWYFIQNGQGTPSNYTKIHQDLNQGAGGTYNYLCFTKIGDPKIKQVSFFASDNAYNSDWYNGWRVYRQDLNTGAKRTGKYIYLIYKTETAQDIENLRQQEIQRQNAEKERIQKQINAEKIKQLQLRKQELQTQKNYIISNEFNKVHQDRVRLEEKIETEEKKIEPFIAERGNINNKLIILIGNTGHGKSSFGNRLMDDISIFANKGPYTTSYDNDSCTKSLQKSLKNNLSIIDCPGWNDSDGDDRGHTNNLCEFLRGCGGINAIVLIIKVGKFDSNFKDKLKYMEYVFGAAGFWKHLMIVLTHIDKGMPQMQFKNSNKLKEIQKDIDVLSKGENKCVTVIPIGLDNYKDKLEMFMENIPNEKYDCKKIQSPINDLKQEKNDIQAIEGQIQQRVNDITAKINEIDKEIEKLST